MVVKSEVRSKRESEGNVVADLECSPICIKDNEGLIPFHCREKGKGNVGSMNYPSAELPVPWFNRGALYIIIIREYPRSILSFYTVMNPRLDSLRCNAANWGPG
jgi:hypothetical protein